MSAIWAKMPEPTGTSIAPWVADRGLAHFPCMQRHEFAHYWTLSGRSAPTKGAFPWLCVVCGIGRLAVCEKCECCERHCYCSLPRFRPNPRRSDGQDEQR